MNKKIVSIVLGLALIVGFFLPLYSGLNLSAFDAVKLDLPTKGFEQVLMKYIWIIFPLCGLILVIGALNNNKWVPSRMLWAILPLLAILYLVIRPITSDGMDFGTMIKLFGIGFWVLAISSIVLAVVHPKR